MSDTRTRILDASSELFRRNGYPGTGLKQIAAAAEAPFGSIYHFFPGGKQNLGEEVVRVTGPAYGDLVYSFLDNDIPLPQAVTTMFAAAATLLEATDYADACPIATIALEVASTNETLRIATADVFTGWIDKGTDLMVSRGLEPDDAREWTIGMICSLEGAFVLARAMRTTEPLVVAGAVCASRLPGQ